MADTADEAWLKTFEKILREGGRCAPRGKNILELQHHTVQVDMEHPVVRTPARKLNYKFMAAEAWWILEGRDDVAYLSQFNPNIAQFSDDGVTLAGSYGKRVPSQITYVVNKLLEDIDTRQATMSIWTPNPAPSKDIPCTIALDFKARAGKLNCHVFMRSSDAWLGLPYDIFAFSMVAHYVIALYNIAAWMRQDFAPLSIGTLYLTAASSHVYEEHWKMLPSMPRSPERGAPVPAWMTIHPAIMVKGLDYLTMTSRGDPSRWWEAGL